MKRAAEVTNEPETGLRPALKTVVPILVVLTAFWIIGLSAIDFGDHWDEGAYHQNLVRSIESDLYLPQAVDYGSKDLANGFYGYPSFLYLTAILATAPELVTLEKSTVIAFVNSKAFLLRLRTVCVFISSLTFLWVYFTVLQITRDRIPAVLAAMALLGSWEFGYHARWVATDAICGQWAALAAFLTIHAVQSVKPRYLVLAAAVAGVAASTKYTAGALILIPLCGLILLRSHASWGLPVRMAGAFAAAFILITPGAVLQPRHLFAWMKFAHDQYAGEFYSYTVPGGAISYAAAVLRYTLDVAWSPIPWAGLVVAIAALYGVYQAKPHYRFILLVYPVGYLAFLCTQRVLIIRNVVPVLPLIAILAGIGVMRPGRISGAVRCALALVACVGLVWQVEAVRTIRGPADGAVQRMLEWAEAHPEYSYQWSPQTRQAAEQLRPGLLTGQRATGGPPLYVMYAKEDGWLEAEANHPKLFYKDFGPYDVNLAYYPTWVGQNHVVMLDAEAVGRYRPVVFDHSMAGLRSTAPPGAAAYASVLTEWAAPDSTGTKIAIREGAPFQWSNYPTLPKVYVNGIYGWQRIVADLTGLDVSKSYRVHLTWWDCDQRGRVESVYLGDQLAMKNVALPRKPGDVFADLPRSSSVKLTVVRESGVNAVLNEIWIEEVH